MGVFLVAILSILSSSGDILQTALRTRIREGLCAQAVRFPLNEPGYISINLQDLLSPLDSKSLHKNLLQALSQSHRPIEEPIDRFGFTIDMSPLQDGVIERVQGNDLVGVQSIPESIQNLLSAPMALTSLVIQEIQAAFPKTKSAKPKSQLMLTTSRTKGVMARFHTHEENCVLVTNLQWIPGAEGVEIEGVGRPEPWGHLVIFTGKTRHRVPPRIHDRISQVTFYDFTH